MEQLFVIKTSMEKSFILLMVRIYRKDQYGENFWFESIPDKWVIVCIIKI